MVRDHLILTNINPSFIPPSSVLDKNKEADSYYYSLIKGYELTSDGERLSRAVVLW